jgi:transcriptional regulator with XRE-family HTH domain
MENAIIPKIRAQLQRLNMSAREASMKAGLGPDGIRNILRGKSENPERKTLLGLAKVLGVSVGYLVGEEDFTDPPPPPADKNGHTLDVKVRRFRAARHGYFVDMAQAAEALGLTEAELVAIEKGDAPLTDAVVMRFAVETRTPLDWLLRGLIPDHMDPVLVARIALVDPELLAETPPLAAKKLAGEQQKEREAN